MPVLTNAGSTCNPKKNLNEVDKMMYNKKKRYAGFTLVEMLVVIGIIGLLAGALVPTVSHVRRVAKRSKAQRAVTNLKVALNTYLQSEREWNGLFGLDSSARVSVSDMAEGVDYDIAKVLSDEKLLDLVVPDNPATSTSLDRFGYLDEWGRFQLRRNPEITSETETGTDGIKIKDHRLQFRLDTDYDGYVDSDEGSPLGLRFRTSVIVWSRGPDGKDDFDNSGGRYPKDDLISWNHSAVLNDQ